MDLKKKIDENGQNIEKSIIALIFLAVIIGLLFDEYYEALNVVTLILQASLITFYFLQLHVRIYALLWAGFLLQILTYFFADDLNFYLYILMNVISYFTFGLIILLRALKMSFANKNFELLTFIVGFLLVFQVVLPFIKSKNQEIFTFYTFALSFAIGTIIYNDNLWNRYNQDEKNIIKYILIVAMALVIQSTANFL